MTTLHTASYRAWTPRLGQPVVTSLMLPGWIPEAQSWPRLWSVAPTWAQFAMKDPAEFEESYLARLERLGAQKVARALHAIARETGADALVLLCWEAEAERCHRSLWSSWWTATTGEKVTEVELTSPRKESKS
jgi:Protein of unknown function, DUF488